MTPEIEQIEETNDLRSFGRIAYQVYKGAMDEGATPVEATLVTGAWFQGMFAANRDNPEPEDKSD